MNELIHISSDWISALGWTFIHSLWQIALLTLVYALFMRVPGFRSAQMSYALGLVVLLAVVLISGATFYHYLPEDLSLGGEAEAGLRDTSDLYSSTDLSPIPPGAFSQMPDSPSGWTRLLRKIEPFLPIISFAWLLGIVLMALRFMGSCYVLHRLRRVGVSPVPIHWQTRMNALSSQLGISRKVVLSFSEIIQEPLTLGHFKPIILIPVAMLGQMSPDQVEALLLHELAHIRRYDFLVNLLQSWVEILFFFHPAIWWISAQIRDAREACCDDEAVAVCQDPLLYAQSLTQVSSFQVSPKNRLIMSIQGNPGRLTSRIYRILGHPQRQRPWGKSLTLLLLGVVAISVWAFRQPEIIPEKPSESTVLNRFFNEPIELEISATTSPTSSRLWLDQVKEYGYELKFEYSINGGLISNVSGYHKEAGKWDKVWTIDKKEGLEKLTITFDPSVEGKDSQGRFHLMYGEESFSYEKGEALRVFAPELNPQEEKSIINLPNEFEFRQDASAEPPNEEISHTPLLINKYQVPYERVDEMLEKIKPEDQSAFGYMDGDHAIQAYGLQFEKGVMAIETKPHIRLVLEPCGGDCFTDSVVVGMERLAPSYPAPSKTKIDTLGSIRVLDGKVLMGPVNASWKHEVYQRVYSSETISDVQLIQRRYGKLAHIAKIYETKAYRGISSSQSIKPLGDTYLAIVNGKRQMLSKGEVSSWHSLAEDVVSVKIIYPPFAEKNYGPEAKGGVVMVTSRNVKEKLMQESLTINKIEPLKFQSATPPKEEKKGRLKVNKQQRVVLDGKLLSKEEGAKTLANLDPAEIATVNVVGGEHAVALYGNEPGIREGVTVIQRKKAIQNEGKGKPIRVVLDGILLPRETGSTIVANLEPTEIESMSVIKGESAVAIYGDHPGMREGVVVIQTKRPIQKKEKNSFLFKGDSTKHVRIRRNSDTTKQPLIVVDGQLLPQSAEKGATNSFEFDVAPPDVSVRVRGDADTTKQPLFVLDGVPLSRKKGKKVLHKINPKDIKFISVLKGKSAIALYGDEGRDGVILITTKLKNKNAKDLVGVGEELKEDLTEKKLTELERKKLKEELASRNEVLIEKEAEQVQNVALIKQIQEILDHLKAERVKMERDWNQAGQMFDRHLKQYSDEAQAGNYAYVSDSLRRIRAELFELYDHTLRGAKQSTKNLDEKTTPELKELVRNLDKEGRTVISLYQKRMNQLRVGFLNSISQVRSERLNSLGIEDFIIAPNPHHDQVSIALKLTKSGNLTIKVLDLQGKIIHTVFEGLEEPGTKQWYWDSSNVSAGTYLVRIERAGHTLTKRIIKQ